MLILKKFWFSGDIILFPDEYNSILIRTEINVPEIPKTQPQIRKDQPQRMTHNFENFGESLTKVSIDGW